MRIGLLDHMGGGNLGDDTTQQAMIDNIKRRWPAAEICGFSMNPADTQDRLAIKTYPIRRTLWIQTEPARATAAVRPFTLTRFLRASVRKSFIVAAEVVFLLRSLQIMRSMDMFIVSGGGQLLDSWGGAWEFPYTILKWVALAKLSRVRCCFVNVGAGPISHSLSRFFIRHALRMADYVSFRDTDSKHLAAAIGYRGPAQVYPDAVYGLAVCPPLYRQTGHLPTVGLSPMAYCDPRRYWHRDADAYGAFVRKFTQFGSRILGDYNVRLFSTDIWFDTQTLAEVDATLRVRPFEQPITDLRSLLHNMGAMDYIVTCRFHGVIFAHIMNIPVIALSHHPKVKTLMRDLDLSEFCLDIDSFDVDQLMATFRRLVADRTAIKAQMCERHACYKAELAKQFDELFPPISDRR